MSGNPGQDYISDGITEDIITDLSRFSELFGSATCTNTIGIERAFSFNAVVTCLLPPMTTSGPRKKSALTAAPKATRIASTPPSCYLDISPVDPAQSLKTFAKCLVIELRRR
jgi:hypothetical protein